MIEFVLTYWLHSLIALLFVIGTIFFVINQKKNINEWLLFAVIEAEKGLGSNTGKIKLRQVYDWFLTTFPVFSKFVSFKVFSKLVDNALIEMKRIIANNEYCNAYVKGVEGNGNSE